MWGAVSDISDIREGDIMAYMMYSIDEAVDRKFIITKNMSSQAKPGTLIHIMDTTQTSDGISVDYRVTETGQDFTVKFDTVKQFCKWCRPDTFIARYYEYLNDKDIINYMKVSGRSFTSFCLPLIIAALVIVWVVSLLVLSPVPAIIVGAVLSIIAVLAIFKVYKDQKTKATEKIYSKIGNTKWGVVIK